MIENINDLPIELLVHVFSFLPSKDLIGVSRICKRWAAMVSDDDIWKEAFLKIWGRSPDIRLTDIKGSWRDEYLARSKIVCPWSRRQPQKVQFNVDQVNDLEDCHFWRAKDGQPRFAAMSMSALLTATIEPGQKLHRSVSYAPKPRNSRLSAFNHEANLLATVTEDYEVVIQSLNPSSSSFTVFTKFSIQEFFGPNASLLEGLWWISSESLAILYGRYEPQRTLMLVDLQNPGQVETRPIDRYVTVSDYYTRAELNGVDCGKDEMFTFMGKNMFWINTNTIYSTVPGWRNVPLTWKFFKLSEKLFLRINTDHKWSIMGLDGTEALIALPTTSNSVFAFANNENNCTRVLFTDEEGWQWMAIFKLSDESDLTPTYEFIRFRQGLHDSSIEDVYFGKSVIIILRATVLAVHDAVSLRLLLWQLVPHARKDRTIASADRRPDKRLLHVIEEDGIVLFEWTEEYIQIWNFGEKIQAFLPAPKQAPKASHKKQLIESEIRSGYAEWREEKEAETHMDRLRGKFNLDGMTEEEMLALAMSQSRTNQEDFDAISRQSSIVYEPSTDDEELRKVLELSLHDK